MTTEEIKTPFDPDGGKFVENIRSLANDDDSELRESMKRAGWIEHLPAFRDENGVVIVGHRRLKIAEEEGIKPVIVELKFGKGDAGDMKRFQLAVASNTGGKGLTPKARQRIVAYLYNEQNWSQAAIAEALNVSQQQISRDLATLLTVSNVKDRGTDTLGRKKSPGRPRNSEPAADAAPPKQITKQDTKRESKRGRETPRLDRAREIVREKLEANEPIGPHKLQEAHGISHVTFDMAITAELAAKEARQEVLAEKAALDPSLLGKTAQEKLEAAIRQHKRKLDAEFDQRVDARIKQKIDEIVLPHWKEKIEQAQQLYARRKGLMDKDTFNTIRRALHPDSRQSISDKKLGEAFDAFMALEKYLLNEKDSPTELGDVPSNLADWDKQRKQAAASKRAAKQTPSVRR